jgi:hypothetical protein
MPKALSRGRSRLRPRAKRSGVPLKVVCALEVAATNQDIVQRSLRADRHTRPNKAPKSLLWVSDWGHGYLTMTVP